MSDHADALAGVRAAATVHDASRAAVRASRALLRDRVRAAAAAGATEHELQHSAGVARGTIRAWLGRSVTGRAAPHR